MEVNEKSVSLSYKEYHLLIVLLESDGKVLTREELFAGYGANITENPEPLMFISAISA